MNQPYHLNSLQEKYIKALEMLQQIYDCLYCFENSVWALDDVTQTQLESFLYQGGTESLLDIELAKSNTEC
jgi:hypothetical protein